MISKELPTPVVEYHYAKRITANNYQYQYSWVALSRNKSDFFANMGHSISSVETKTLAAIEEINADLVSNTDGSERLFIKNHYRKCYNKYDKQMLGFFILEPKSIVMYGDNLENFFIYNLVITPKPGLFPPRNE